MKSFSSLAWNAKRCRKELEKLRALLVKRRSLNEREHILPLFRGCRHLSAFLGSYHSDIDRFDRIAFEYELFGDFSCDLVVGDSVRKGYNFIEFEDAGPNSMFKTAGKKSTREWSARFDHGFSQIIDWFGKLHDMEKTDEFEKRFGARSIDFIGTLVVGRDHSFQAGERRRLEWRRQCVVVDSRKIVCVTYDELLDRLSHRLDRMAV
jgi:Domain of unknown function (DUF4263)